MKLLRESTAAAAVLLALAAPAAHALTFTEALAPANSTFTAPAFTTADPTTAYVTTGDIVDVQLTPLGATRYLNILTGGSAEIALDHATSFTFLWGSPDPYNMVTVTTTDGFQQYSGDTLISALGGVGGGSNDDTRLFTVFAGQGQTITSVEFASSGNSFELAIPAAPVPEPDTYALMLGGLAAVGFVARRRRG